MLDRPVYSENKIKERYEGTLYGHLSTGSFVTFPKISLDTFSSFKQM